MSEKAYSPMKLEEEVSFLRKLLKATQVARDQAQTRWFNEMEVNERAGQRILFLEKAYEEALEQLVYRDEYFRLYESKWLKELTKSVMTFKKIRGKLKSYALRNRWKR